MISEYVYVLSVCLQSIVDELMLKKSGNLAKVFEYEFVIEVKYYILRQIPFSNPLIFEK